MSNKIFYLVILLILSIVLSEIAFCENYSLNFDGDDDYVSVDTALLNNLENWTFSCWIYPEGNSEMMVYSEGNPQVTFELSITGSNKLHVGLWNKYIENNWIHFLLPQILSHPISGHT
jgi:hypothetical protein